METFLRHQWGPRKPIFGPGLPMTTQKGPSRVRVCVFFGASQFVFFFSRFCVLLLFLGLFDLLPPVVKLVLPFLVGFPSKND